MNLIRRILAYLRRRKAKPVPAPEPLGKFFPTNWAAFQPKNRP